MSGATDWTGAWVRDRLGVTVTTTGSAGGRTVADLAGLALRRNPRRAHLLVSPVLGKHVPVDPRVALAVTAELGALVAPLVPDPASALVVGYAETATALGHEVARTLGAYYLHSTRRPAPPGRPALLSFDEVHSHAQQHRLLPDDPGVLARASTVVLVDDELSTGRTALATIRALHAVSPTASYVVAALLDLRDDADRALADDLAAELGVGVDVVALAEGRVDLPADVTTRAAALLDSLPPAPPRPPVVSGDVRRVGLDWPADLPDGGRHGAAAVDEPVYAAAIARAAGLLEPQLVGERVHVLGTEELIYLPMRLAAALADHRPHLEVTFSSTTRSPVAAVDDPTYAVRSALTFPAHDAPADGPGPRFAYNLIGRGIDTVVVVVDAEADTPALAGLTDALATVAPHVVVAR